MKDEGKFFPVQARAAFRTLLRKLRDMTRAARRLARKRNRVRLARVKHHCFIPAAFRAGHVIKLRVFTVRVVEDHQ